MCVCLYIYISWIYIYIYIMNIYVYIFSCPGCTCGFLFMQNVSKRTEILQFPYLSFFPVWCFSGTHVSGSLTASNQVCVFHNEKRSTELDLESKWECLKKNTLLEQCPETTMKRLKSHNVETNWGRIYSSPVWPSQETRGQAWERGCTF